MMRKVLTQEGIQCADLVTVLREAGLNVPFVLEIGDFLPEQNSDDVLKFMQMELAAHAPVYDEVMHRLEASGDEVSMKQLKSARVKFDQSLVTHSLGRTFQTVQREFYEKLFLVQMALEKKA
jgi:hypothetical protein